jgi:molybdopterin synthase sulfur carrier subunit
MMIKVVFFAALREQLGCNGVTLDASEAINSVGKVKQALTNKNETWLKFFENNALLAAVNHDMVDENHPVKSGDEVAFFPPVTGG